MSTKVSFWLNMVTATINLGLFFGGLGTTFLFLGLFNWAVAGFCLTPYAKGEKA